MTQLQIACLCVQSDVWRLQCDVALCARLSSRQLLSNAMLVLFQLVVAMPVDILVRLYHCIPLTLA
jgi:hypothetical protein